VLTRDPSLVYPYPPVLTHLPGPKPVPTRMHPLSTRTTRDTHAWRRRRTGAVSQDGDDAAWQRQCRWMETPLHCWRPCMAAATPLGGGIAGLRFFWFFVKLPKKKNMCPPPLTHSDRSLAHLFRLVRVLSAGPIRIGSEFFSFGPL
jgi:hypothetical protein